MNSRRLIVCFRRIASLILVGLLLGGVLFAQINRGTLTGVVTDPAGASVPAAKITARELSTTATSATVSNAAGQWTIPNLTVGTYEISVTAPGFKTFVRSGVTIGVSDVIRIDAKLEVGEITQSVQVSGEAPRLETDAPQVSTAIGNRQLMDLPLNQNNGRTAESFAYSITPGVSGSTWSSHINGSTEFSKESTLDGATVTTYLSGHFGESSPSVEAVQEFKIQTSGMSAEFGRTEAGVFNYAMKSGTNEIHGSALYSLRNEALNANTFSNKARNIKRPLDRQPNYAVSFGGPVYLPKIYDGRDKTFFYTAYEQLTHHNNTLGSPSISVPIPEYYQGDFSRILGAATSYTDGLGNPVYKGAIYDPRSFTQLSNGQWVGQMFTGNKIPADRFSTVAKNLNAIATQYYLPTVTDASGQIPLVNNASVPVGNLMQDQYQFSVKMDHIISEKHRISGSYTYNARPRLGRAAQDWSNGDSSIWAASDPTYGGPLSSAFSQRLKSQLPRIAWDWTISPTMLNHAGYFYNRMLNPNVSPYWQTDGAQKLGIKNLSTTGYPAVIWGQNPYYNNMVSAGDPRYTLQAYGGWGVLDTLSFSKGRHFMKAGWDFRRNLLSTRSSSHGEFFFDGTSTAIPGAPFAGNLTGFSFASYLLGIVYKMTLFDPFAVGGRINYNGFFLQDDFKVTSKLTLNLGVRVEFTPPDREAATRLASWDPNVTDPSSGLKGAYTFAGKCPVCTGKDHFGSSRAAGNWGPRFGFAYSPTSKWAIRGAYGLFYEAQMFNNFQELMLGKRTSVQATGSFNLSPDPLQPWAGIFNWDNGFPTNRYTPASYDVSYGNKNQPGMIDPGYGKPGYISSWNLNIQRELIRSLVLDVGYVGNKSTGLRFGDIQRVNQLRPSVLSQYGADLSKPVTSAADAAKYGIAYPFTGFAGSVASALRPYPQIQGTQTVVGFGAPLGFSTYHSLQTTLNRQFSQGLSGYFNFTWSKNMSNQQSSMVLWNAPVPKDYYNLKLEKAVTSWDMPRMFKAFVDYELPMGRGKPLPMKGIAQALLGGWSVQAILNYFDGTPLQFNSPSPLAGYWNGAVNRANIAAGDMKASGFDKSKFSLSNTSSAGNTYLNKSLFSNAAPLTLGTAAPYFTQARGFGTINEDMSLHKNWVVKEKYRFQIRADFLNAFNRHNLGSINTTIGSPVFGQVTSAGNQIRVIQIGARVDY